MIAMHRFLLSPQLFAQDEITLPDEIARQVRTVLRLRPGESIIVLDGQGNEAELELAEVSRAQVRGRVRARRPGLPEPRTRLTLCQGLLKPDLFEWVLQKGTELGVSTFIPMRSQRSLPGSETISPARLARWQTILREAAEQCGRSRIPTLSQIQSLEQLLQTLPPDALALMPWEGARAPSLHAALRTALDTPEPPQVIFLFTGPRDGLSPEEARLAALHGVQLVTLGPRILRAETAALAAATIVLSMYGELG